MRIDEVTGSVLGWAITWETWMYIIGFGITGLIFVIWIVVMIIDKIIDKRDDKKYKKKIEEEKKNKEK